MSAQEIINSKRITIRYCFGGGFCAGGWLCAGGATGVWPGGIGIWIGAAGVVFAGAGACFWVCSRIEPVLVLVSDGPRFTESVSDVIMKTIAHHVVARERNEAAPRGPNAVWLPAPPNAPARSAAFPLCSMITMISTKQTSTCSVTRTYGTRQPIEISPIAISNDNPHFAHDGIPNSPSAPHPFHGPTRALKIHNRRKRLRLQARPAH